MLTLRTSSADKPKIRILLFADSILGVQPYDWQCQILLNYEAGNQTAAACANFTGKTSTVFPIAALWTLYNFPRARLMYLSATSAQVKNQFFASLSRFRSRPAFTGWTWLETEVKNTSGGFLFGRATDTSGNIEGLHDQPESPAAILVDEAKSIRDEILDALERCSTSYRLFMSSTGRSLRRFLRNLHRQIAPLESVQHSVFHVPARRPGHNRSRSREPERQCLSDQARRQVALRCR